MTDTESNPIMVKDVLPPDMLTALDVLDNALCQFLNNASDEFDPRVWIPSIERDFARLADAYNQCHVVKLMDLRAARAPSGAEHRPLYAAPVRPVPPALGEIGECRYCANTGWFYGDPELATFCGCAFGKLRETLSATETGSEVTEESDCCIEDQAVGGEPCGPFLEIQRERDVLEARISKLIDLEAMTDEQKEEFADGILRGLVRPAALATHNTGGRE